MANSIIKTNTGSVSTASGTNIAMLLKQLKKTKMFDQLCVLVLDGSGSMSHLLEDGSTKTEATKAAAIELIRTLKKSTKSSGFHVGIICYDTIPQIKLYSQPIDSINEADIDLGEEFGEGSYTRIDLALLEAEKMASAFLKTAEPGNQLKRDARILLMSDGYCNEPENTKEVSINIKSNHGDKIRMCCCLLSDEDEEALDEAETLMKHIASNDKSGKLCFTRASTGRDLRSFFEGSSTDE